MMSRVDRAMRQFEVPYGRFISVTWLAIPLCGAMLMILASHGARVAHRVALFGSLVALMETVLLLSAYHRIGLDPWAGRGLAVAMCGAVLAAIGTTVACLPHAASTAVEQTAD